MLGAKFSHQQFLGQDQNSLVAVSHSETLLRIQIILFPKYVKKL